MVTGGSRVRLQGKDQRIRNCSHVPLRRILLSDNETSEEGNFLPIKTIVPGRLKIVPINLKRILAELGGRDIKMLSFKALVAVAAKFLRKLCCQRSHGQACRRV